MKSLSVAIKLKASEQQISVILFMVSGVILMFELVRTIQMKAVGHFLELKEFAM